MATGQFPVMITGARADGLCLDQGLRAAAYAKTLGMLGSRSGLPPGQHHQAGITHSPGPQH
jgi:hypothetical protein